MMCWTLTLEKLYHHLFSMPECDSTSIDHLKHDLVLWLNHHSFEELPDALEYYLANPTSDLEADLSHLNLLDQRGVQVTIHPIVTIYICTLLAWAKCFLATYGEYPGLYDLLDTPRSVFIATQLHLHDSTFPRPLLPQFRGPPTLRNESVALQPHLAPPTPPDHLYACLHTHPSIDTSVCQVTSPSIILSDHMSTSSSVILPIHHMTSPSILPICPSYEQSIHHPVHSSLTHPSVTPPVCPVISPSDHTSMSDCLYAILPHPFDCPSSSDHSSAIFTSLSDCLSPPDHLYNKPSSLSDCPLPSGSLTETMTRLTACPSSNMIQHKQDSSQSLAVMNGSNPTSPRNSAGPLLTMTSFYIP